jgi:hypothetical protein
MQAVMLRNRIIIATVAGCTLAFWGVYLGMWWLMMLGFMLAPLSFMPWGNRRR